MGYGFEKEQVAPPSVKWTNHIHDTGSYIALTFLFIKPSTKRDLLVLLQLVPGR